MGVAQGNGNRGACVGPPAKYQYREWGEISAPTTNPNATFTLRFGWYWVNFCDDCYGSLLSHTGNFTAGAGDALTLGLTRVARKGVSWGLGNGYGDNVDYNSGTYMGGVVTGTAIGVALGGPKGPIFGGPKFQAFGYQGPGY